MCVSQQIWQQHPLEIITGRWYRVLTHFRSTSDLPGKETRHEPKANAGSWQTKSKPVLSGNQAKCIAAYVTQFPKIAIKNALVFGLRIYSGVFQSRYTCTFLYIMYIAKFKIIIIRTWTHSLPRLYLCSLAAQTEASRGLGFDARRHQHVPRRRWSHGCTGAAYNLSILTNNPSTCWRTEWDWWPSYHSWCFVWKIEFFHRCIVHVDIYLDYVLFRRS